MPPRKDPSGVDPAGFEHYVELLRQGSAGTLRVAAASRVLQREAHRAHLLAKAAIGAGYSILDDPARLYSDFRPTVVPAPKLKAAIKDPEEVASDEPDAAVPDGPLGGPAPEGADGGNGPSAPAKGGGGKADAGAGPEPAKAGGKEKAASSKKPAAKSGKKPAAKTGKKTASKTGNKPAAKTGGAKAGAGGAGGVGGVGGEEKAGPPPEKPTWQDAMAQSRCGWDKRLKLLRMKEREIAEEKEEGRVSPDPKKLEDVERLTKELSDDERRPMADPCGEKTEEELEEAWRATFDERAAKVAVHLRGAFSVLSMAVFFLVLRRGFDVDSTRIRRRSRREGTDEAPRRCSTTKEALEEGGGSATPAAAAAAPRVAVACAAEPGGLAPVGAAASHLQDLSTSPACASRRGRRARACLRQRYALFL
ncbi:unnamed protein product [Prorocentrum cordatum]|uniref:Uncharacterized protein n=1 Tax=Prorocentrum cordatum TaxID=2364126 RepID=A0ABN9VKA6_9DINO|nr:unnamed protein product [Polarella glacialis]